MTRSIRPRRSTLRALTGTTVLAAAIIAAIPVAAQAAEVSVPCSETALVGAINTANAAPGDDTLNLAAGCTYGLTSAHGGAGNGLPVITSVIELVGTPNIITRSGGLFRIAEVSSTGNLTLTRVTLDNGSTLGSGGGVLNRGAVTFTSSGSGLTNNTATLGTGGGLSNVDTPGGTAPAATFTGSTVSGNIAGGRGGGIYNGLRGSLSMTSSVVTGNSSGLLARGGGIAAIDSTATTLTDTPVSVNNATLGSGGIFRLGGTMTTNTSPISANTSNNCVGSAPAVPSCTA